MNEVATATAEVEAVAVVTVCENDKNDKLWQNFNEKIKDLQPQEQEAIKQFWRSLVLPSQGNYAESNGHLPQYAANVRSCKCCPYGYHIDLDFVRYCEALANAKPSAEELQRRTRRRSRMSMEFMLGLESLFDQWDAAIDKAMPERENERETPDCFLQRSPSFTTSTPLPRQQRSASVPRFTYSRSESPFATNSSTCSSYRGVESDVNCLPAAYPHPSFINTSPDTKAFLQDALGEVCSDFERTLERASMKRNKYNGLSDGDRGFDSDINYNDRNNNSRKLSASFREKRNGWSWYKQEQQQQQQQPYLDNLDSCISGHKSPSRQSSVYTKPLPFQQKPSPAEQQYESYVKATVAANAKSPVEDILPRNTPPAPPPRRHTLSAKLVNSSPTTTITTTTNISSSPSVVSSDKAPLQDCLKSPLGSTTDGPLPSTAAAADPQTLFNIREQMALSLKRMKDLEEQVKIIPELKNELCQLREEKQHLQQTVQRKEEELQRARDVPRFSSSPSPAQSPKYSSPIQFQPQRVSPIALESMGSRLRSPTSSEKSTSKSLNILKRDVGTICLRPTTRDIAVGDKKIIEEEKNYREVGCNTTTISPLTTRIDETLYTKIDVEERIKVSIQEHEEHSKWERLKSLVSVGTQIYIPKIDVRDRDVQTVKEKTVQKYNVGIMAQPSRRDAFVNSKPDMRSVGSSQDRISDVLCEKCKIVKRSIGCGPEKEELVKSVSLKLLDMPGRSNTFSLGETEKLNIKRKTVGTQYTPTIVNSAGCQTSLTVLHTVATQHKPDMQNSSTQFVMETISRHTDTNDLLHLGVTPTRIDEIASPLTPSEPEKGMLLKTTIPLKKHASCNTEMKHYRDIGVNVEYMKSLCHTSSNTEAIHKRDIGCGDVVKPHISIACADNYCDSCKDAIKNLAKDFSKVVVSPQATKVNDSKIPRPRQLTSPSPVRRTIHRQNTYTVTPPATPSPVTDKKRMISSLTEKSEIIAEKQSFLREQKSTNLKECQKLQRLTYDLTQVGDDDLVVREEKRVSISWSRDNSPAPSKTVEEETQVKEQDYLSSSPAEHALEESQGLSLPEKKERTQKYTLTKDMLAALNTINNSLLKKLGSKPASSLTLKSSKTTIQQEWFRVTNSEEANPYEVEDYLECFEELSIPLLEYCVNMSDSNGNTAMHYAVSHGNFDVVSVLLNSKVCNVNQMNNAGYTCVMLVSLAKLKNPNHRTIVERLFQMSDVNIKAKKHSQTALMLAVSHGNLEMVKILIGNGADVNIQDDDGSTALMCAAEHGRGDIVKHLLSHSDCDSLIKDVDGSTAFKIAWQAGHRDIGMLLYLHEQMMRSKLPQHAEITSTQSVTTSPTNRYQHKRQASK